MTEQEYNQAVDQGQANTVQPAVQPATHPAQAQPEDLPTFDENQPLLESLRRPRKNLTAVPTFIPKTFADSIQYIDNGIRKYPVFYINNVWTEATPATSVPVAFDNATNLGSGSGSISSSHQCAGTNRMLIIAVYNVSADASPTSVTYNGVALTELGHITGSSNRLSYWYLINPTLGSQAIVITATGIQTIYATASSYTGCSGVIRNSQTSYVANNTSTTITVTSAASSAVVDACATTNNFTINVNGTQHIVAAGNGLRGHSYSQNIAPSTTMMWSTSSNTNFLQIGAELVAGIQ